MSIHKSDAIVLSRRDFHETSIIANFYTAELGKIRGLLKGMRAEPSKFASTVEPFSYNEIVFYKKRNSSLHLVSQCDLKENFNFLRRDIVKVGVASIFMELIDGVCPPEDRNDGIFNLVLNTLSELAVNNNPEKIMAIFKIKALDLAGFKPHLDSCVSCGDKILNDSKFSLSLGGLLCPKCRNKDSNARSIFRGTVATILHIERNDFRNNLNLGMNPQIRKELELILNSFLNFHLGRELKSEKVLSKLAAVA